MRFQGGIKENRLMGGFFHGWRRKTGCVILFLACVFLGGWVRSWESADEIEIRFNDHTLIWFVSCYDWVGCGVHHEKGFVFHKSRRTRWTSAYRSEGDGDAFQGYDFYLEGRVSSTYLVLPYSVFVIPLTLLAAFLLLSKPRKSTQTKKIEPLSEMVK